MIYVLDSNIIIYLLKGDVSVQKRFQESLDNNNSYVIPLIVKYEVQRGLKYVNATARLKVFEQLCADSLSGEMDQPVWDKAVDLYVYLRGLSRLIEDADLLIAAFCLIHDCVLVTNNIKHYMDIPDLKLENWK